MKSFEHHNFVAGWIKPVIRWTGLTVVVLTLAGALNGAQPESTKPIERNPHIESLPAMVIRGRAPMGIRTGIACKGMLWGDVVRVAVMAVSKDGRAAELGVREDDELIAINGTPLVGLKKREVYELMETVSQAPTGSLDIRRKGVASPIHIAWVLKPDS